MRASRLARLAALACIAAGALPAHAGMLKCEYRTMTQADFAAMKYAATKATAPHLLNWHGITPCMNPGRGRVWIDAQPETRPDGTRLEIATICEREKTPWKCELQVERHYEFTLPVKNHEQKFDLVIPEGLAVEDARAFVAHAIEKALTLKARDMCGIKPGDPPGKFDVSSENALADAIAPRDTPIAGSISEDMDSTILFLGTSVGLEYSLTPHAINDRSFQCWGIWITVT